jgi:hypothetical protein
MNTPARTPLLLSGSWPVGARLRFRRDAEMRPQYRYLRGTPVLVLGPLTWKPEADEWRQYVTAFGAQWDEHRYGWALPSQLEPIPGEGDNPAAQLAEETVPGQRGRLPETA